MKAPRLGDAECYADAARRRIWLIDTAEGGIICTWDCDAHQATGPDDPPPPWAKPADDTRLPQCP